MAVKRSKVDFCCGNFWRKLMDNHHSSTQRSQEGRDEGRVAVISCKQIIGPQVFLNFSIIAWQACTSGPINRRDRGCGQPRRKIIYSYSPLQLLHLSRVPSRNTRRISFLQGETGLILMQTRITRAEYQGPRKVDYIHPLLARLIWHRG